MSWPLLILCVIGAWAFLRLLASDRSQRMVEINNRLYAEAQAILEHKAHLNAILTVGGPVASKSRN